MSEDIRQHSPTARVAHLLSAARQRSGFSLRELAALAQTSHTTLCAYEKGHKIPSATVLLRIVEACNLALDVSLVPRIRSVEGLDRGEELKQALLLAEQFPSRVSRRLETPPFPTPTLAHSA